MTDEMICVEAVDAAKRLALREMQPGDVEALEDFCDMVTGLPVSYTHLTLPTILLV